MKKSRKLVLAGTAAALAAAAFTACSNRPEALYGPPPDDVVSESSFDSSENIPELVYGPPEDVSYSAVPEFDPSENIPEDVYGPPEDFEP